MSDNDYIAEYVKARHPHILGFDFALWKAGKMAENMFQNIADALFSLDLAMDEDEDEEDEE